MHNFSKCIAVISTIMLTSCYGGSEIANREEFFARDCERKGVLRNTNTMDRCVEEIKTSYENFHRDTLECKNISGEMLEEYVPQDEFHAGSYENDPKESVAWAIIDGEAQQVATQGYERCMKRRGWRDYTYFWANRKVIDDGPSDASTGLKPPSPIISAAPPVRPVVMRKAPPPPQVITGSLAQPPAQRQIIEPPARIKIEEPTREFVEDIPEVENVVIEDITPNKEADLLSVLSDGTEPKSPLVRE